MIETGDCDSIINVLVNGEIKEHLIQDLDGQMFTRKA